MRYERHRLHLTPSVLDRLLDDHPKDEVEGPHNLYFDLARLKKSVARDLEALLNSRNVDLDDDIERFPQARQSVVDFGIPDLSSLSLLDPGDRAFLRDKIRITLEHHEPRLERIVVSLDAPEGNERMLRFRVDALLKIVPGQPPVCFDATLQLSSNSCHVRDT